jgi:chromatin segregation and condensation protein Rec8/ScpA/Scc1 (kleisin family)
MSLGGSPGVPVMAVAQADTPPAAPAVTFGEGRRPESRTQVQMAEFDGPLALLLSLIEARQLDVLTVPLGALADAYLDALGRLEADRLVQALDRLAAIAPPPEPPAEVLGRTITITERAEIIRAALRGAPTIVLQELLAGVRDRVVISVTFLAMLELMKRREIVVEQAEPWGPIVARATTTEERAAAGVEAVAADLPLDESLESFA